MSDLQIIKTALTRFVENPNPQIFAIKWDWGSWKTFFWNDFFTEVWLFQRRGI